MRALLFGVFFGVLSLVGCGRTYTIPIESVPAYAAGRPVRTVEGYPIHTSDGGSLSLAPHRRRCLEQIGDGEVDVGERQVPVVVLANAPEYGPCERHRVKSVRRIEQGEVITLLGKQGGVQAHTADVRGIRVHNPNEGAAAFAPRTSVRSSGLIGGGIALCAAGIGGMAASIVAATNVDRGGFMDFSGFEVAGWGLLAAASVGAGLGGGIPMIVFGAKPVRDPVRPGQEWAGLPVAGPSPGGSLAWRF